MSWTAYFHPKFKDKFDGLSAAVQDELLTSLVPLREYGPSLGRPEVDTLKDSKYANMKELRFRTAEAFGVSLLPLILKECHSVDRRKQIRSEREKILQTAD